MDDPSSLSKNHCSASHVSPYKSKVWATKYHILVAHLGKWGSNFCL